jgi:hypothetical protein
MHILITQETVLREIQEAFSNYFPFLKIEFYRSPHKIYKASPESDQLDLSFRVGDLDEKIVTGQLQLLPHYKVSDVEKEFQDRFGISVQIFRQQKDSWEQTTGMDDFTLKQLNEFGRDSSDEKIVSDYEQGFVEPEERPEKLL